MVGFVCLDLTRLCTNTHTSTSLHYGPSAVHWAQGVVQIEASLAQSGFVAHLTVASGSQLSLHRIARQIGPVRHIANIMLSGTYTYLLTPG